ncbi:hypothetical protein N9A58_09035 [Opitutales bacterium]|nr:hypothetical protein [Opitutales bacterium]
MHKFYLLFFLSTVLFLFGCRKFEQEKVIAEAEPYTPKNLYPVERLPTYFNRVLLMPCYHPDSASSILEFADETFYRELSQARLFEVVQLSPARCLDLFGKPRFSSSDALPDNFMQTLANQTLANGVAFVDLHSFKPYKPMSLGVRCKLVDLKSGEFMWAIDETIDAGDASVIVAANIFQRAKHVNALSAKTAGSVLQSPRLFTKFSAQTLFSTLPTR